MALNHRVKDIISGQPRQTAGAEPGIRMNPQFGNAPTNPPPNNQAS
jgi:hypothetical protein